ncbi:hypothetical protein WJX81_000128 [Elliptochloris bilobata]|uniref:Uncharacterized protein n=1 Tax=Elliptochloris bilobata TaxID=381761 RepID=A0AAW1RMT2_9CHLO
MSAGTSREAGQGSEGRVPHKPPPAQDEPRELPCVTQFVVCDLPCSFPAVRPAADKPNPRVGIGKAVWSPDGQFLATRNDAQPGCVWLWSAARLELASVVQQDEAVQDMAWRLHDGQPRLAIVTGSARLYLWSAKGASCVLIPLPHFQAASLRWNPAGTSLVLTDRLSGSFCCAYLA